MIIIIINSTLIGVAMLGVIGCIALGFSVIGLVAFGVMVFKNSE